MPAPGTAQCRSTTASGRDPGGPLLGARGGDRCALALISLALDEGDATVVLAAAFGVRASCPSVARRWRACGGSAETPAPPTAKGHSGVRASRPDTRSLVKGGVSTGCPRSWIRREPASQAGCGGDCSRGNAIASEELAGRVLSVGYVLLPGAKSDRGQRRRVGQTLCVGRRLAGGRCRDQHGSPWEPAARSEGQLGEQSRGIGGSQQCPVSLFGCEHDHRLVVVPRRPAVPLLDRLGARPS